MLYMVFNCTGLEGEDDMGKEKRPVNVNMDMSMYEEICVEVEEMNDNLKSMNIPTRVSVHGFIIGAIREKLERLEDMERVK